jgi:hypothetical protein
MNFKKWVKSIQTAGYNGARTVYCFFLSYYSIEVLAVSKACVYQTAIQFLIFMPFADCLLIEVYAPWFMKKVNNCHIFFPYYLLFTVPLF